MSKRTLSFLTVLLIVASLLAACAASTRTGAHAGPRRSGRTDQGARADKSTGTHQGAGTDESARAYQGS